MQSVPCSAKPFSPTSRRSSRCLMAIASSMASRVTKPLSEASCANGLSNETRCYSLLRLRVEPLFTQPHPTFSSVSMARTFVLNDLFVLPEARKSGVGRSLLGAAAHYARRSVPYDCRSQQPSQTRQVNLSRGAGWRRDEVFYVYHHKRLTLPSRGMPNRLRRSLLMSNVRS